MRFVFAVLCLMTSAMAQNITVPTVWTKAQSPITVRTLNVYSTLTIEAGVEVRFTDSSYVRFWRGSSSQLIVNGTTTEPVVFKAAGVAPWSGIMTAAVMTSRPIIRASSVIFQDFGAFNNVLDLRNADFYFKDCKFVGPPIVQAGYSQAGQAMSVCRPWGTYTPIGTFEGCEVSGFTNGVLLAPGMAVIDCDFTGVTNPVAGRLIGVSALGM